VGGRLIWESTHPGAPTSIDYPTYDASKYSLVAGRLQQMIGQPKNPSTPGTAPDPAGAGARPCPKCATPVPVDGAWCPGCGLQVSDPCWECRKPLADGANFCAYCGTPNSEPAVVQCPGCKAVLGPGHGYCAACGTQARTICQSCERVLRKEWSFCPDCGGEPSPADGTVRSEAAPRREAAEAPSVWTKAPAARVREAEEANAAGIRAFETENYAEAARHFRAATEADATNASYHTNLGVAYGELDDDTQAFAAYRRAVELNPREAQAYLNMGYLYNERERTSEAREMWEKVVQLVPDSEEAREARDNLRSLSGV
jgi:RNA polymerase subunit RPABC4/transcription elongation factor Spt4